MRRPVVHPHGSRLAAPRMLTGLLVLGACAGIGSGTSSAAPGADPATPSASPRWGITDLGSLGGTRATYSIASAINDRGQVVGFSDTNLTGERDRNGDRIGHAFLWEKGRMRDLGTLGGPSSRATGINDRGQVVGCSTTRTGNTHAFLWQDGRMRDLGTLGGPTSCAAAIDDRGQVVGTSGPDPARSASQAFLWSRGTMTPLDLDVGGAVTAALAINDSGQIAVQLNGSGSRAVVWEAGRATPLGRGVGAAIDDRGRVAGWGFLDRKAGSGVPGHDPASEVMHAFLWRAGSPTDLGTLGGRNSMAQGINDAGLVVGWSERRCSRPRAFVARAFVWAAGRMTGLVGLSPRLDITGATDVNDRGRIVGYASTGGGPRCVAYPRLPESHAVMWTRTR